MKAIILIIIAIAIAGFIVYSKNIETTIMPSPTPFITGFFPTPANAKNRIEITYNNQTYNIFYSPLNNNTIELIPNFTQKISSDDLISEHNCKAAINGGFYTTDNTPLGLFIANGKHYSSEVINDRNLLTGFFWVDNSKKPMITDQNPQNSDLVIQTGPILYKGYPFSAEIDEYARRSVIARNDNSNYYLLMVTLKDDIYSGPQLADLGEIIYSNDNPLKFMEAINMDGGSASTFFDNGFHIQELSSIGSLLCIQ
ncbi:phosphodiester glycosidase family protein [Candidatus Gottesmanbacteria bacterium]|nr:phosphodiester glycosidase family protein [Candidatus Gottesmanbacteria bacterium]